MKKRLIWLWKEHRKIAVILILGIIVLLSLFGTQIYLFINFLLGNNVVVKLEASPQLLKVDRGETATLQVKVGVTTNPFCSAACSLQVNNLADNSILLEDSAVLRPGLNLEKEVILFAREKGHGAMPIKVELKCAGIKTFFCHTDGQPTTRNLLVIAEYNLGEEEIALKQKAREKLSEQAAIIKEFPETFSMLRAALISINDSLETTPLLTEAAKGEAAAAEMNSYLQQLENLWGEEDYLQLHQQLETFPLELQDEAQQAVAVIEQGLHDYNQSLMAMKEARQIAALLSEITVLELTLAEEIKTELNAFNLIASQFNARVTLLMKQLQANAMKQKMDLLWNKTIMKNDLVALSLGVETKIISEVIRSELNILNEDLPNISLFVLANETPANVSGACSSVKDLQVLSSSLKPQLEEKAELQNYSYTKDFNETITLLAENALQAQRNQLQQEIPVNAPQKKVLQQLLYFARLHRTTSYPNYNLNPAVLLKVMEKIPKECTAASANVEIQQITAQETIFPQSGTATAIAFTLSEPPAKCCVNQQCSSCCTTKECRENPEYYPIIFLHGHAFNKETSYEYSLDAFNGIQQKLEEDGFISAGAVSLYTKKNIPPGELGLFNAPMTIKASYYVDLFQTPENYVVIQTKSEGIDVYALRLKEIMDTIKYQMGRPKVIIAAHSMGGLVARRYLQIFGSADVAKLITIGTPHQGIAGDIADYCDFVGEQRECNDMNVNSVFMNKLKFGGLPSIPIITIIGAGCDMDSKPGDGIVWEQNAELEGAKKYLIKGACSTFSLLHTDLLDVSKYPEVYQIIKEEI